MKRKKWWQIGVAQYSKSVQRYFFFSLLFLIAGSNFTFYSLDQFPKVGWLFYTTVICWIGFIFSATKYVKKSKQEYGAGSIKS